MIDDIHPWIIVQISLISLFIYYFLFKKSKFVQELNKIPGPPKLPLLGNALDLFVPAEEILPVVMGFLNQYGKRIHISVGAEHKILLSDRFDFEKILTSQAHINKSVDYDYLFPWLGTGLLTSKNEKWAERRKMLTPTFHFRILDDFLDVFNEQSLTLIRTLKDEFSSTGGIFDIFPYVTRCALDIICETAMGKQINAQHVRDSDYVKAIYRISDLIQQRQFQPWLQPDFIWKLSPPGREEKRCLSILHGFTEKVIRERKAEFYQREAEKEKNEEKGKLEDPDEALTKGKRRLAFMDLLLEAQKKNPSFTDIDIREETDTFMFEGHDTTAASINWTIFLLGCHPEYQKKVHEEMDGIFGGDIEREITTQDLGKMKYLEYCIKESLRLYPSVPFISRALGAPLKLDDKITLPKGAVPVLVPYFLHRDPEVFEDPSKFDPSRFYPENANGRHPFSYVPFSAGPRNCIGQKFALMEEKVVLAHFFRNFNVKAEEKREDIKLLAELILRPKNGLKVQISERL